MLEVLVGLIILPMYYVYRTFQFQKWREIVFAQCLLVVSVARIAHTRGMTAYWLHDLGDGGWSVQKYQNEAKLLAWLPSAQASIREFFKTFLI
jgi:hypothetical protein